MLYKTRKGIKPSYFLVRARSVKSVSVSSVAEWEREKRDRERRVHSGRRLWIIGAPGNWVVVD